ncbi:chromosome segregation protein SMC [Candidatus Galacturonibacter soehngenii]|uniref:Chromosome partition protein Smc n=1 Tax=Candidatus Galacturonatibacter soehngenii TaxID=2307010 RepID=A0A7V7QMK5_9FIRM|nr:chromosome segregation protein SMC [Candidatus Galacturonibacter soehngenii]KAB1439921.1 chromosome segregation protein SMC [Candidatus Galacturonibacter soehngenii]
MYLKSIEVQGFKSFANKIVFEFHNGITGIVGPNGSGKSNVGDAVRWVLGEQSAKQLRGSNMQDVIFSGTENRKPLGFAYVAITLDNSDRKLAIDFEEVTVARRVYRSGESEYLINGTSSRLKDVQELFYDTGIGKEGYSIIGQGQIDKILSGKPEERRELFDEAAGIVKYKRRKATAQKKLEDEKQNLLRVSDILTELEKQLGPLQKQSETARTYLKKKEELKVLDVNLFLMDAKRIEEQLKELDSKLSIAEKDLESTKENFENTKIEYEKLENEIEELNQKIDEYRNRQNESGILSRDIEGKMNVLKEQIHSQKQSQEHLQERVNAIRFEIQSKTEQKNEFSQTKEEINKQLDEMDDLQTNAANVMLEIQSKIASLNQKIDESKNEIFEILNERASTKGKMQRFDTMLEQITLQKAELSQKLLKIKSEESEQDELLILYNKELDKISTSILKKQEEGKKNQDMVKTIQEELTALNEKKTEISSAYHRQTSRLDSLINITEKYDGYGNSIRRIMERKDTVKGIIGVVADIIKVEKEYEIAIETALGGSIQNVVTEDEDTAKQLIEYLKSNKFGRATFLPLTSIGNKNTFTQEHVLKEKGVIQLACNLVSTKEKYQGLSKYLLGRTIVVNTIENAILLARKFQYSLRIVTLEGEQLSPGGSMSGGAFKNTSNLLGRRREIDELKEDIEGLRKEIELVQHQIDEKKTKRIFYYEEIERLSKELQEQYLLQNTAKMNVNQANEKKSNSILLFEEIKKESLEIEQQLKSISEGKEKIQIELNESEIKEKEFEELIAHSSKLLEEERAKEIQFSKKSSEINLEFANLTQKNEFILDNIRRINQELNKLNSELTQLDQTIISSKDEILQKEKEIELLQNKANETEQEYQECQEKLKLFMAKKEELTLNHKGFFAKREELSERINLLDKEVFRLTNQKEKLDETSENQINYMWNEYEITYSMALQMKNEAFDNQTDLKKMIHSLKEEIRKLGDVNVNAIEDYKNLFERHQFLKEQRDDLVESEETLLKIIEELDSGMRKQFKEKFELIRVEFDKAFKELFGGGKGTIELIEEEDILEAGVRIISQPPGKKLQNMMQLSGGEKALTAIALLFAIQNLKPSPFCLLDEIEAALDDSNVSRFARYLHKLTKNTQFIIITHRRGTMASADRLYGITMQEKGVSTLVSVNLIEDDLDR